MLLAGETIERIVGSESGRTLPIAVRRKPLLSVQALSAQYSTSAAGPK